MKPNLKSEVYERIQKYGALALEKKWLIKQKN